MVAHDQNPNVEEEAAGRRLQSSQTRGLGKLQVHFRPAGDSVNIVSIPLYQCLDVKFNEAVTLSGFDDVVPGMWHGPQT